MAGSIAPKTVTDGLVLYLDAANSKSVDSENLALNSQDLNLWSNNASAIAITPNSEIAPDGTLTADRLSQRTDLGIPAARQIWSTTRTYIGGVTYTLSIWLKKISGNDTQPAIALRALYSVPPNPFLPPVSSSTNRPLTNEWVRYSVSFTLASTVTNVLTGMPLSWGQTGIIDEPSDFVFAAWGFQVETGDVARDYFRTTGTPKLRSIWNDLSGRLNTGQILNEAALSTQNGGSIVFDGTDDYVKFGSSLQTSNITVSTWIKPNASMLTGGYKVVIDKTTGFDGWYIFLLDGKPIFFINGDANNAQSNVTLTSNWFNIVGTYNQSNISIYVNGNLTGTTNYDTSLINNSVPIELFSRSTSEGKPGNYKSAGNCSQTLIYNRALSDREILRNFNAMRSRFGL